MFASRSNAARRLALSAVLGAVALGACQTGFLLPSIPGALSIKYSSYSGDVGPFGWTLTVDGAQVRFILANDTGAVHFDMEPGEHSIAIKGVPPMCTGGDSRTVTVKSRDTAQVIIDVKCPPRTTGDIRITIRTTGVGLDTDGYLVNVDTRGGVFVSGSSSYSFLASKVPPGNRPVVVSRVAPQCAVTAASPRSAYVVVDSTTNITIDIVCAPIVPAYVRVLTSTVSSGFLDPNGYLVDIGVDRDMSVATSGTLFFPVRPGTFEVTLSDIEPSCVASTTTTRTVTLVAGDTAVAAFSVTCDAYPTTTAGVIADDPILDTLQNTMRSPNRAVDLISLNARHGPGFIVVTLRSKAVADGAVLSGSIDMDLDESPVTGRMPNVGYFGGTFLQGVDAWISLYKSPGGATAYLNTSFTSAALRTVVAGDSIQIYLPHSRLRDDGNMTLTALVGPGDRNTDIVPNAGVVTVHAPSSSPSASAPNAGSISTRVPPL